MVYTTTIGYCHFLVIMYFMIKSFVVDNIGVRVQVLCPTCNVSGWRSDIIEHMKIFHGPAGFPWVCGVCNILRVSYFSTSKKMRLHWRKHHPHIQTPRDVLHPKLGRHHSQFPYDHHTTGGFNDNDLSDYVSDSNSD